MYTKKTSVEDPICTYTYIYVCTVLDRNHSFYFHYLQKGKKCKNQTVKNTRTRMDILKDGYADISMNMQIFELV